MDLHCVRLWKDVVMELSRNSTRKTGENRIHTHIHTYIRSMDP